MIESSVGIVWAPPYFRKLDSQVTGEEEEEVRCVQDPRRTRSAGQEDSSPQGGHHREQEMIESSVDTGLFISMVHHMIQ